MIDTIGSGIRRMFSTQRKRYFPLPDYDLSDKSKVEVKIFGKVLDLNYTKVLKNQTELDLVSIYLLDKVQKKQVISLEDAKLLRQLEFIEGKYPNVYVSSKVAETMDDKANYIRNKAFDDIYYIDLIKSYLTEFGSATRAEIDSLIENKLSDALNDIQKKKKIDNLVQKMKKQSTIMNEGTVRKSKWVLSKNELNS